MKKILILLLLPILAHSQVSWVNLQVKFDFYGPSQGSYIEIEDSLGNLVFSYQPSFAYEQIDTILLLSQGEHDLYLGDNNGNGWTSLQATWVEMSNSCQGMIVDWQLQGVNFYLKDTTVNLLACPPPYGGCLDTFALNYDSLAGYDDGSCLYPSCGGLDSIWVENFCDVTNNKVWYRWTNMPNPNCRMLAYTRVKNINDLGNNWYVYPSNFSNTGLIYSNNQPNTTYYFLGMLTDSTYTDTLVITTGECIVGCTNPIALNYNPWVNIDDGSCQLPPANCATGESNIVVTLTPDTYPGETSWEIADTTGTVLATSPNYNQVGVPIITETCIPNGTVIEFTLLDSFGDGMCGTCYGGVDGSVVVQTLCGDTLLSILPGNANFGNDTSVIYTVAPCIPNVTFGCTDPNYLEYDPKANVDDSSCVTPVIIGCTDSTSPDYNSLANKMDIIPNCNYTLIITDGAQDGWFGSWLGLVQDSIILGPYTMGPYDGASETFTISLNSSSPVEVMFFAPGNSSTTANQCGFYLIGPEGDTTLSGGTNSWTDPMLQFPYRYSNTPYCGNYCTEGVYGCMDSLALNYDSLANMMDTCIAKIYGCTNSLAFNYDSLANIDDGSCVAITIGCMDSTAFNFNSSANVNDSSSCVPVIYGCMDDTMFNYNPAANTSDNSCIPVVFGCTDMLAFNYNSQANTNNGSCIAFAYGCTDPTAFNYDPLANTNDSSCVPVIYGCIDAMMFNYDPLANTDNGSCIPYLYGCIDSTMWNYDPFANTDNNTCIPYIYGCTNPIAINYDPNANTDDFSCVLPIYGCMDSTAFNYDPNANVDNGSCVPVIYGCTNPIALNYCDTCNTDDFSCILPIYGCMDSTAFNYNPLANVDNGTCVPIILGCTDPIALNYCDSCNTDDFSCILPIYGCTDSTMFNYNPLANVDNNSCVPYIYGCTDPSMLNYDPLANTEDFSCIPFIYGCTDPTALNYDSTANTDNGSCITIIEGCMDQSAYNYNMLANLNDSASCLYSAGCVTGAGNPYWLNDPCYAWVISIDDYCCNNAWDQVCQSTYDYCANSWTGPILSRNLEDNIVVYPNPVDEIININKYVDITIRNILGDVVIHKTNTNALDVSRLNPGVYNLQIMCNNKLVNKTIVKN